MNEDREDAALLIQYLEQGMQHPKLFSIPLYQIVNFDHFDCLFDLKWELLDELAALRALWGPLSARPKCPLLTSTMPHGDPVVWEVCLLFHKHL